MYICIFTGGISQMAYKSIFTFYVFFNGSFYMKNKIL